MKRFSSLATLASISVSVGLSLTTATAAFAGPDAKDPNAKPTLVAQAKQEKPGTKTVQPTDPAAPEGSGTPAPTAPADAAPAAAEPAAAATEPGSTPAISIGTSNGNPATDTPGATGEDGKPKPKPRAWAGSQIFATTSMTTSTVFKGQTQYDNPTVDSSIWLQPRYALSDAFQLRGLLVFSYEYTNADDTTTKNEPRFSDTTLSLFYRKIPEIPGGIKPAVAISAGLPTSPESRARTLVVNPGLTLQLVKPIEHVLGGEVDIIASGVYSHPFYRSTTSEIRGSAPYARQCISGTSCQDQLSGTFNVSDSFSYSLIVVGEWGKWSPALFYRGTSQGAYTGSSAQNPVNPSTTVSSPAGFEPTHIRQRSYFSAWLDYNANSWFTAEVGYWLDRTTLAEDGTRGNPFFDRYQDMRVYIGANFNIDNIMKQLEGGQTEAGIVRAKNSKGPIGQF